MINLSGMFPKGIFINSLIKTKIFTPYVNYSIATLIKTLLSSGSPATVSGLVISAVIYPIQGVTLGFFSHVFQEITKIHPPRADFYSTTTVVRIKLATGCPTTIFHLGPDIISGGFPIWLDCANFLFQNAGRGKLGNNHRSKTPCIKNATSI